MKRKLLFVDDNADWRATLTEFLEEAEFTVTSFGNLGDAKKASQAFDRFVVDGSISSPGNGIIWAKELLKNGKKVVVVSGGKVPQEVPHMGKEVIFQDFDRLVNLLN